MRATRPPERVALLGNPNCGKTAIFNQLTGSRQKVANYAGVTIERKAGLARTPSGRSVSVLDLPGAYSLNPLSADEAVTRDVVTGQSAEPLPDLLVCVVDATHLRLNLRLVLEARRLGLPMVVALNMMDMARRQDLGIDVPRLAQALGVPVIPAIGVRKGGAAALLAALDAPVPPPRPVTWQAPDLDAVLATQREVHRVLWLALPRRKLAERLAISDRIDRVALHPVWGMAVLAVMLFLMFQAVFNWAQAPMNLIAAATQAAGAWVRQTLPAGPLQSLIAGGIIAGAGSVITFLPQILILFFFILALEESGYLPRAAFLLDRVMGRVGLSGRAFIPLLSSFACAVPGIMATRTIGHWRDRLVTIMIAPLMTCSARLPVYALLIAAFIPPRRVAGLFNLQGLVLFALYALGIVSAMAVAWALQRLYGRQAPSPLLMELPVYHWPNLGNLLRGLWERMRVFLQRVGTVILALTVLLWFLSSYPAPPAGVVGPAIQYSAAGIIGGWLAHVFAPLGFNWQICIALVPGLAAREVVVGALGTVYALSASGGAVAGALQPVIARSWTLATALSLLAWYVYAPQCASTLVAVKNETGRWQPVAVMAGYLFGMAYAVSFIVYRAALAWTGG
ncbi:MAG: ferrous iron transporter B [Burkholderiaceae bacterium]|nr:ferrous iron transporter B [Burkholderiaceae bacterium]